MEPSAAIADRLARLLTWFAVGLRLREGRSEKSIVRAVAAFRRFADWKHGTVEGASLFEALERLSATPEMPELGIGHLLHGFPPTDDPAWEVGEIALIAGLTLCVDALEHLGAGQDHRRAIATLYFADACAAKAVWTHKRGFALCRVRSDPASIEADVLREKEEKTLTKSVSRVIGRSGGDAKAKLDKDGKQAARTGTLALWKQWQAGKYPKQLRRVEDFATEMVMRSNGVLTSIAVICRWSANWTKQVRAGLEPT